jgi:hypothetical protein
MYLFRARRVQEHVMTEKPQYSVTLLPGNEVRFLSLSRTANVKPEYRPMGTERYHSQAAAMFAVEHYTETGRILLHSEVRAILLKRKRACTKERKHEYRRARVAARQEEMRL